MCGINVRIPLVMGNRWMISNGQREKRMKGRRVTVEDESGTDRWAARGSRLKGVVQAPICRYPEFRDRIKVVSVQRSRPLQLRYIYIYIIASMLILPGRSLCGHVGF